MLFRKRERGGGGGREGEGKGKGGEKVVFEERGVYRRYCEVGEKSGLPEDIFLGVDRLQRFHVFFKFFF